MRPRWLTRLFPTKTRPVTRGRPAVPRLGLEALEQREVPAVFANLVGGQLRVTDTTAADVVTLDHSGSTTFVNGVGFADSQITNGILIQVGTGGPGTGLDTVNIRATVKPVTIDGQFDTKVVSLGKSQSMQGILAPVNIFNLFDAPNGAEVILNDRANTAARNVTLDASGATGTITGLAPATITYEAGQDTELFLIGGSGGNTFNVVNTPDAFLSHVTLNSGFGNDTVNVRAVSDNSLGLNIEGVAGRDRVNVGNAGSMQGVESFLTIRNAGGFTDLTLDNSADPVARNVTMVADGPGGASRILGLTPNDILSEISYDSNDVSLLHVRGGSGGNTFTVDGTFKNSQFGTTILDAGTGVDTVNVQRTEGQLFINGQAGQDNVNIGGSAGSNFGTANIKGNVFVTNVSSRTALNVSDFSPSIDFSGVGRNVTLDHASAPAGNTGTVSGLAPALVQYISADVRSVTLTGGNFADAFAVRSTPGLFIPVTVNGGFGNDLITVGSAAFTLDGILGPVTVNGGLGSDVVSINDQGSTTPHTYTQTATSLTRSAPGTVTATVNYPGVEFLAVNRGRVAGAAPQASDLALTETVRAGGFATLSGQLVDEDEADVLTLTVDWGDGSDPEESTPDREPFALTHRYAAPGTYTVRAIWTDSTGESSNQDLTLTVLGPAPAVESVVVNDGSAQRSMVGSLTVTFSGPVRLDPGAFELLRADGTAVELDVLTFEVDGKTVAALTFRGEDVVGGSLADGDYRLVIRGDLVRGADGQPLDGDRIDEFSRRFGDADGDGDVDRGDRREFRRAFGSSAGDEVYLSYFDHDGDGDVDRNDRWEFRARFAAQTLQPCL